MIPAEEGGDGCQEGGGRRVSSSEGVCPPPFPCPGGSDLGAWAKIYIYIVYRSNPSESD